MKDVHHWIGKYIVKYIWDFFFFDSDSRILQGQKIRTLRFSLLLVPLSGCSEGLVGRRGPRNGQSLGKCSEKPPSQKNPLKVHKEKYPELEIRQNFSGPSIIKT